MLKGEQATYVAGPQLGKILRPLRVWVVLATLALSVLILASLPGAANAAPTVPDGFKDSIVLSRTVGGLQNSTNLEFSNNGMLFVAEKRGTIKVFDNLSDTTPTTFADLRTNVYNANDRGLLGLALDPSFPTKPYVYVLYTHDAPIGGTAPRWGTGLDSDPCPDPPGANTDGCVVSGRLSRLEFNPSTSKMTGQEQVLIEDWCQQFSSHSIGDLGFGSDGALYVSAGAGDGFNYFDYGQGGGSLPNTPTPKNPCGDPPTGVGGTQTPPTAEGGSLRSQDLETSGDPVTLDGSILRVDPATGDALPDNPLYGNTDPNARRIIAYGQRNPFRFTIKPGTNEVWVANVGSNQWEEINRIANPTDSTVENFGWPCYEGAQRKSGFDSLDLNICENLYRAGTAVEPYYAYGHKSPVGPGDSCPSDAATLSGLAFYEGGSYPDNYDGALFMTDYVRDCMWVMEKGANGLPDKSTIKTFATGVADPVDLEIGPNGDLFYVNIFPGEIHRIEDTGPANQQPKAVATADRTTGAIPLTVNFDGTGSSDPDPTDTLSYAWDLDGDGAYDDSTEAKPTFTYNTAGSYRVDLKVTDSSGASDTLDQPLTIDAGNTPPAATINSPSSTTTWKVGDMISFSGAASDEQDGALPASALSWSLIMHHCTGDTSCHEHPTADFPGVDSGSFTAPDHEYPSYMEVRLTATDSGGLEDTKSVRLDPKTVVLNFRSDPAGLQLVAVDSSAATPFSRTVIVGSDNSISAPTPQTLGGTTYEFASWSDGGARSHNIIAPATESTYTATDRPAVTSRSESFVSAADTRISEKGPDKRYGLVNSISVDGDNLAGSGKDEAGLIRWSLSNIPAGSKISTASITLNVTDPSVNTYQAYALKRAWTEAAATWNLFAAVSPWEIVGAKGSLDREATVVGIISPSATGKQTFALSPAVVQRWVDSPATNQGIIIANETNTDGFDFDSRDNADASLRPQLTVTYTSSGAADTTPPETTIDSGPSGILGNSSASFAFSSSEANSTFECSLDGASFSSCTSPQSYTNLSDGTHTFQVRATDAAKNVDASPAQRTWTVDTMAPTVDATEPADGATGVAATSDVSATFSEAISATTISGSTFTLLKQGTSTPATAQVSYDSASRKATLNPDANLESGVSYTATLKGGANGVKDAAGNPLAQDMSWSFTTASAAPSVTQSFVSAADTRFVENAATTNYGSGTTVQIDGDDPAGSGMDKSGLIRWDLSSVPAGSKVSSASITLNITDPSVNTYQAYALKRAWVESAATWNLFAAASPWEIAGAKGSLDREATVVVSMTPSATGKQTFSLSSEVVQRWVDNSSTNQGIIIANETNKDGFDFNSRNNADASLRPQLTVTYASP